MNIFLYDLHVLFNVFFGSFCFFFFVMLDVSVVDLEKIFYIKRQLLPHNIIRMKKRFSLKIFIVLCVIFVLSAVGVVLFNIPFSRINIIDDIYITRSELTQIQEKNFFGPFLSATIKDEIIDAVSMGDNNSEDREIEFKLFHLIPIKVKTVHLIKEDKVLLGGYAVGLVLKTDGVMVVGSSPVDTLEGEYDVLESGELMLGDIITQIENETIENVSTISKVINKEKNRDRELTIHIKRDGRECVTSVKPCYDVKAGNYKLGIWARDDASGIGTLTFVDSNNRFGALGHPILDSDTKSTITLKSGKVYNCSILGVKKGQSGSPGELKGFFAQGKDEQGVVEKNNEYGVFGSLTDNNRLTLDAEEIEVGGRLSVKPGKAQIKCCLDGNRVETFDIEIVKTNYQSYSGDKSMVIRVVDEDLISRTGGIVQGMSGSPIIQNDKIVGAVTHVFVTDPTKGFGVYIDWMLNQ